MIKKFAIITATLLMAAALSACDRTKPAEEHQNSPVTSTEMTKIRIACTEISCTMLEPGLEWMKEQQLDVELVMMDGNINVIRAVNDGSLDAALGVHIKFMESFNQHNNGTLAMVKPYPFTTGIGLYSERYLTLEQLPQKATIAIMNDAMNMDRALRMLQNVGLIELRANPTNGYTLLDVTANPKELEFIDMDQSQTVRSLQDVDAAVIFFTHMRNAGKDFRTFIIRDSDAEQYPMGIVVRQDDLEKPWATVLAKALRSEPVRQGIAQKFDGVFEYLD